MSKLHQNLTAIITTLALVIAGFAAVTHHHDHSAPGHSCDLHAHHQCCSHHHADNSDGVDSGGNDCCGGSDYQFALRLPQAPESFIQEAGGSLDGDHLCVFCRFLTEHAAQISPQFDTQFSTRVYLISPVAVSFELPVLPPAFLQRGPPVA